VKQSRKDVIKGNLQGGKKQQGKHPGNTPLGAPLTKPQANEIATKRARGEAAPVISAIKGEREGSLVRQEKQIPEWFGALNNQINQAAQATDASYGQANAALLAHAQAGANAAQATQGQIAASNADMTALTGADSSLTTPALAEGAAAAGQRDIANAAIAAPIAQAGASQAAYLRNTGINATREGIQQRQLESKRRQEIKDDLTAARKARVGKKYEFLYDPVAGLRQGEINNEVKRDAFNLDKTEAQINAEQGAASQGLDEAQFSETQRHNRATEANAAADNSVGGLTPTQKHAAQREKHNAMTAASTLYRAAGEPDWSGKQWTVFIQRVAMEDGIDYTAAKRAVNQLRQRATAGAGGGVAADPNGASLGR
jgi:hypothetical protein